MNRIDENAKSSQLPARRSDNEAVHRRIRWGIYAATGAAAFFLIGFVATWQVALSQVINFESNLGGIMITMYAIAAFFVAFAAGSFLSATRLV